MPDDMELLANLANQNRHMGRYEPGGIGMRHDGGEVELLHEGHDDLSVLNQKGCGDIHGSSYGRRCLSNNRPIGISRQTLRASQHNAKPGFAKTIPNACRPCY